MHTLFVVACCILGAAAYLYVGGKVAKYNLQLRDYYHPEVIVFFWPILMIALIGENVFSYIVYVVTK